ncbi:MAG TPA: type I restriction enzyme HsdR N-terminal domain-containing protein [Paludibacteraceae bacterium]|nr:type I restriction enzyme HsdR N-terminal domain-containing protein [Paludibacteraceae bacterium]HOS37239.1 type I restriction enzyme HsdR N-terminal domain-containing protein [Paludibacteraceae bacterium]HPK20875.1 type I restriction enzyme HsdR N-terminal domain-containing protein [Paludibacteraceae bacterium]
MESLNLPKYTFKIKRTDNKYTIFDCIRKRYVALTPEEWVRQNVVQYLITEKNVPQTRISNETSITFNGLSKRCDTIVYDKNFAPLIIVEYKAPTIPLSQATFDQVAVYNLKLDVKYFLLSNGMQHIFCKVDAAAKRFKFIPEVPDYSEL